MLDAAKEKGGSKTTLPGKTRALWAWLCLVVAFCLAGTRAEAFFASSDQAPGILATAAQESTGKTTTAWQYDALDPLIAANSAAPATTRFIAGARIVDRRTGTVIEGTVDLGPTLNRIRSGGTFPHPSSQRWQHL